MRSARITPLVAFILLAACSGGVPGSTPPPAPSDAPGPAAPPGDENGAGFADPAHPPESPPPESPQGEVAPELAARIKQQFGERCRHERACGDLIGVDCESAVDGPYYYVRRDSLEIVSRCGGFCRGNDCTECPPKGWTCATY